MQLDMRPVRPLSQGPLGFGVEPEPFDHGLQMLYLEVALDIDPQELAARHPGLHRLPEGQVLVRPVGIEQPDPQALLALRGSDVAVAVVRGHGLLSLLACRSRQS